MAWFITIGYGDAAGYERTDPAVRTAAHRHDEKLRAGGAIMGIAGHPVQVRNHGGANRHTQAEAYLRSELPIAGFAVIEADTISEAVEMIAQSPCAVADGVVEVWPLEDSP